jgi:hypothetical protein
VEEAPVHSGALQETHGTRIAVRQDRFGAESRGDAGKPFRDFLERRVPGDAFEPAFSLGANPAQRIEQAFGVILAFEVAGHLAAEETPCDGMMGIALQFQSAAVLDRDHHRAGVGAIQRTGGKKFFGHSLRV